MTADPVIVVNPVIPTVALVILTVGADIVTDVGADIAVSPFLSSSMIFKLPVAPACKVVTEFAADDDSTRLLEEAVTEALAPVTAIDDEDVSVIGPDEEAENELDVDKPKVLVDVTE